MVATKRKKAAKPKPSVRRYRVSTRTVYTSRHPQGKLVKVFMVDVGKGLKEVTEKQFNRLVPSKPFGEDGPIALGGSSKKNVGKGHTWPMRSMAMSVLPSQVEEANNHLKTNGCNARHSPDGIMHIPDAGDKKRVLRAKGARDYDSYTR